MDELLSSMLHSQSITLKIGTLVCIALHLSGMLHLAFQLFLLLLLQPLLNAVEEANDILCFIVRVYAYSHPL